MTTGEVIALIKAFGGSGGGSGGGVLVVNVTETDGAYVCDKTAGEMFQAYQSGTVIIKMDMGPLQSYANVCFVSVNPAGYSFFAAETSGTLTEYAASSADEYPASEASSV